MGFSERIQFRCPSCTLIIDAARDEVGGKVGCRFCGKVSEVPMRSIFTAEAEQCAEPAPQVMTTDDGLTVIVAAPPPVRLATTGTGSPPPLPRDDDDETMQEAARRGSTWKGSSRRVQGLDVMPDDENDPVLESGAYLCPYCQGAVHPRARKCHGCRRAFPTGVRAVRANRQGGPMAYVAGILSLFWPGLGQVVRGRVLSGLMWMCLVPLGYLMLLVPGFLLHLACVVNAFRDDNH